MIWVVLVLIVGSLLAWLLIALLPPSKPSRTWSRSHRFVHNVLAHPLLELCPPLGERLHNRTAPPDDDAAEVVDRAQRDTLTPFLDRLAAERGPAAPYVLVAPDDVACRLTPGEAMAMVRLGLTHVPNDWQPGTFSIVPSADDARGVLIIPSELVDEVGRRSVNESGWSAP
jgi:hypothetical protein